MRILIVEDYKPLLKSLRQGFNEAGFAVDTTSDGAEGHWYAQSNDYDAIVLDIMLPRKGGLSLLQTLRATGDHTPILLLTARDTDEDRDTGLNFGADDYLVKPFVFDELVSRVRALCDRRYEKPTPVIQVADLEINTETRTVQRNGRPIELTAREFALLELLALRAGKVVSRTHIWDHFYEFQADVENSQIDVYVGHLRNKIERTDASKLIHTLRGEGYLLGEVG